MFGKKSNYVKKDGIGPPKSIAPLHAKAGEAPFRKSNVGEHSSKIANDTDISPYLYCFVLPLFHDRPDAAAKFDTPEKVIALGMANAMRLGLKLPIMNDEVNLAQDRPSRKELIEQNKDNVHPYFAFLLLACLGVWFLKWAFLGWPYNTWTWIYLCLPLVPVSLGLWLRNSIACAIVCALLLLAVLDLHNPSHIDYRLDIVNARLGAKIPGRGLSFSWDSCNTGLVQESLGERTAHWRWTFSQFDSGYRETTSVNIVTNSSLLKSSDLTEILTVLPDKRARTQALRCLTDPDNFLNIHQESLLIFNWCLNSGSEARSRQFWLSHSWFFFRTYDNTNSLVILRKPFAVTCRPNLLRG